MRLIYACRLVSLYWTVKGCTVGVNVTPKYILSCTMGACMVDIEIRQRIDVTPAS